MLSATAVRTTAVAVPSDVEIAERFNLLMPELLHRGRLAAAREKDRTEALQEFVAFSWANFLSAAQRGRWFNAAQLSWYAAKRIRMGCALGSSRTVSDVLAPGYRRGGVKRVVSLSALSNNRGDDRLQTRFDEAIVHRQPSVLDTVAAKLDWTAVRTVLPDRQRRVLDHLVIGRTPSEIAKLMRVSAARITQLKGDLAQSVMAFFQRTWASA